MIEYLKQNCELTLAEGLEEYYSYNNPQIKNFSVKYGKLLVDHDITHVIFGLGTSVKEESLLDTWSIRGTDMTWKQIYEYATNQELKELTKVIINEIGGWHKVVFIVIKCIPMKLKIHFNRIPKMKKKWPFSNVTSEMMETPISDLRHEYGIEVINFN